MPKNSQIDCPVCGSKIPLESDKCPECGVDLDLFNLEQEEKKEEEKAGEKEESEEAPGEPDYLRDLAGEEEEGEDDIISQIKALGSSDDEIDYSEFEETLEGEEEEAPQKIEKIEGLEEEEEMTVLECPVCEGEVSEEADRCPHCGAIFGEEEEHEEKRKQLEESIEETQERIKELRAEEISLALMEKGSDYLDKIFSKGRYKEARTIHSMLEVQLDDISDILDMIEEIREDLDDISGYTDVSDLRDRLDEAVSDGKEGLYRDSAMELYQLKEDIGRLTDQIEEKRGAIDELNDKIEEAKEIFSQVRETNIESEDIKQDIRAAVKAKGNDEYEEGLDKIDRAIEMSNQILDVYDKIDEGKDLIKEMREEGIDFEEFLDQLKEGKEKADQGNYDDAMRTLEITVDEMRGELELGATLEVEKEEVGEAKEIEEEEEVKEETEPEEEEKKTEEVEEEEEESTLKSEIEQAIEGLEENMEELEGTPIDINFWKDDFVQLEKAYNEEKYEKAKEVLEPAEEEMEKILQIKDNLEEIDAFLEENSDLIDISDIQEDKEEAIAQSEMGMYSDALKKTEEIQEDVEEKKEGLEGKVEEMKKKLDDKLSEARNKLSEIRDTSLDPSPLKDDIQTVVKTRKDGEVMDGIEKADRVLDKAARVLEIADAISEGKERIKEMRDENLEFEDYLEDLKEGKKKADQGEYDGAELILDTTLSAIEEELRESEEVEREEEKAEESEEVKEAEEAAEGLGEEEKEELQKTLEKTDSQIDELEDSEIDLEFFVEEKHELEDAMDEADLERIQNIHKSLRSDLQDIASLNEVWTDLRGKEEELSEFMDTSTFEVEKENVLAECEVGEYNFALGDARELNNKLSRMLEMNEDFQPKLKELKDKISSLKDGNIEVTPIEEIQESAEEERNKGEIDEAIEDLDAALEKSEKALELSESLTMGQKKIKQMRSEGLPYEESLKELKEARDRAGSGEYEQAFEDVKHLLDTLDLRLEERERQREEEMKKHRESIDQIEDHIEELGETVIDIEPLEDGLEELETAFEDQNIEGCKEIIEGLEKDIHHIREIEEVLGEIEDLEEQLRDEDVDQIEREVQDVHDHCEKGDYEEALEKIKDAIDRAQELFEESERQRELEDSFDEKVENARAKISEVRESRVGSEPVKDKLRNALKLKKKGDMEEAIGNLESAIRGSEKILEIAGHLEEGKSKIKEMKQADMDYGPLLDELKEAKSKADEGKFDESKDQIEQTLEDIEDKLAGEGEEEEEGREEVDEKEEELKKEDIEKIPEQELVKKIRGKVADLQELLDIASYLEIDAQESREIIDEAIESLKMKKYKMAFSSVKESESLLKGQLNEQIEEELEDLEEAIDSTESEERKENLTDLRTEIEEAYSERTYEDIPDLFDEFEEESKEQKIPDDLSESIKQLEDLIDDASSVGFEVSDAKELLDKGKQKAKGGSMDSAEDLIKDAEDTIKDGLPGFLQEEIEGARDDLKKAKIRGAEVSRPVKLLKQASLSQDSGEIAKSLNHLQEYREEMDKLDVDL